MELISVTNLEKYQHYKDRHMIWLKWNIDCLQDYTFMKLLEKDKWVFLGMMCLACKSGNQVEYDCTWLGRTLNVVDIDESIQRLIEAGMLATTERSERSRIINKEKDLEDYVIELLTDSKKYESVKRQYRIENSYLDILALDKENQYSIYEIKRTRITNNAVSQILEYAELLECDKKAKANLILIGTYGFEQGFDTDRCKKHNIELFIYENDRFKCYSDVISHSNNAAILIREDKTRKDNIQKGIVKGMDNTPQSIEFMKRIKHSKMVKS